MIARSIAASLVAWHVIAAIKSTMRRHCRSIMKTEIERRQRTHGLKRLAATVKCQRSCRAARSSALAAHSQAVTQQPFALVMNQTLVMGSQHQGSEETLEVTSVASRENMFNTESSAVGMDNRASACVSRDKNDFVGPFVESNKVVKTFGGRLTGGIKKGTIRWTVLDDEGKRHTWKIPESHCVRRETLGH